MIKARHFAAGIDGGMPPRSLVQLHLAMYEMVTAADEDGEIWSIAGAPAADVAEGIANKCLSALPKTTKPAEVDDLRNWILNLSDEDKNALRWYAIGFHAAIPVEISGETMGPFDWIEPAP